MLSALIDGNLNCYVRNNGGASDLLFHGRKVTKKMVFETHFGPRGFRFKLVATPSDSCAIEDETRYYQGGSTKWWEFGDSDEGTSHMVAEVKNKKSDAKYSQPVYDSIASWQIYHFHDTGSTAGRDCVR